MKNFITNLYNYVQYVPTYLPLLTVSYYYSIFHTKPLLWLLIYSAVIGISFFAILKNKMAEIIPKAKKWSKIDAYKTLKIVDTKNKPILIVMGLAVLNLLITIIYLAFHLNSNNELYLFLFGAANIIVITTNLLYYGKDTKKFIIEKLKIKK